MNDFRVYSPEDIVAANLKESAARMDLIGEQELAHLYELAAGIAETEDLSELLSSLPDRKPPAFAPNGEMPIGNRMALERLHRSYQAMKSALLCREIRRQLEKKRPVFPDALFPEAEDIRAEGLRRIVYQKSSYTDSAYLCFSARLGDARASYTHSFLSACEEVYNGFCEYCILPIENSAEGQLVSFSRLIERYELKIAATCDVVGNDTGRVTRFALLRRNLLPLLCLGNCTEYFECSLPLDGTSELSDVLFAAQLCDLRLYRIGSTPPSALDAPFSARLSFFTEAADLSSFLLYLAMEAPHYTPIGLYPHLS
ncbi:MAG: hypothetical protein IJX80_03585 [Clostridia bacterium]|nr:hypothetical protein [Clostridia bacterium]